ncbi:MAG TPA: tetratricopeptide repeat protein [Gammaproteobacteria bacterium]
MTNQTLAILPFADKSGGREHLCDGLMEMLTDAADHIGIPCVPRPRAAIHKGPALDLKRAAVTLQANLIMTGELDGPAGGAQALHIKLTRMPEGSALLDQAYPFSDNGMQALIGKVLGDLARSLQLPLPADLPKQLTYGMSTSAPALDAYLRGLQATHGRNAATNQQAIEQLSKAVELDPHFAKAHARLSEAHAKRYQFFTARNTASQQAALQSAEKAVALAPELAEAQCAQAVALTLAGDFIKAAGCFEQAEKLDPRLYAAWYEHARSCFQQGLLKEAAALFEKASTVRPADYQSVLLLRQVYLSLGRLDDATRTARRGIQVASEHIKLYPDEARAYYLTCGAMMQLGMYREAVEWASKALAIDPNDPTINYNVACCYAQIGEYDKAMDCLEKAKGFGMLNAGWVKNDSDLFSLHGNPRFQALLQSL